MEKEVIERLTRMETKQDLFLTRQDKFFDNEFPAMVKKVERHERDIHLMKKIGAGITFIIGAVVTFFSKHNS